MPQVPLETYLRMYRRRTGLSQDDVALLLGLVSSANVSRHERGARVPVLDTALGYETIIGASIQALFEGRRQRVEDEILRRAKSLCMKWEKRPKTARLSRKIDSLNRLIQEYGRRNMY